MENLVNGVFDSALYQVQINIILNLVFSVLFSIISTYVYFKLPLWLQLEPEDYDWSTVVILRATVIGIGMFVAVILFVSAIEGMLNPTYWAVKGLIPK